ncbi:MAG: tetratricopeptide repeat protein [Planctomycetaceae bacterium]|nr:tetratricopeptide repeat protein [Planctomycetaceae bacterium]
MLNSQSSEIPHSGEVRRNPLPRIGQESINLESSASLTESEGVDVPLVSTQEIANLLVHGDLLLSSGNAASALRLYRQAIESETEQGTTDVTYRLALCAEALGDYPEALARYQAVTDLNAGGVLQEYALLGEARILDQLGHTAAALGVLQRWVLSRKAAHHLSPRVTGDALYLLSHIAAIAVMGRSESRIWHPEVVCPPQRSFDPNRYLPQVEPVPVMVSDLCPVGIHVIHQLAESSPETVTLSGRLARTTVPRVISELSQEAGWVVEWSQPVGDVVRTSTVALDFQEQTANLILDWLLAPHGIAWEFDDGRLRIVAEHELTSEQQEERRWQRAERALLAALLWNPDHVDTPAGYLLLGNLSYFRGHFQSSQRHYEHVLRSFPRSPVQPEAWFNLAKVELAEQNLEKAAHALQGAMDASRGQPLESAALLLAGQTALKRNLPQDATRPLMRGVTVTRDDDLRALSLLALATAHLLNNQPERANVALMESRDLLQTQPYRDRAAFLAGLARYRSATTPSRKERDGLALISATSHLSNDSELGLAHVMLKAEALEEIGLRHLAIPLIEQSITEAPPSQLREHLALRLADLLMESNDDERAEALLLRAINDPTTEGSHITLMRLAELYFQQQQIDQVETSCLKLLGHDLSPQMRVRALELLGRVYASRGDRERAVLCFAGTMPQ